MIDTFGIPLPGICIEFGGQYSLLMFIISYTIIVIVDDPFGQKFATLKDH